MDKLTATDYQKKKMRERRKREREYKRHLKQLNSETNKYIPSVFSCDENREYTKDNDKVTFFKRIWRGKRSKYAKQKCNEKVRKEDDELYQGGLYKKISDFWWDLW